MDRRDLQEPRDKLEVVELLEQPGKLDRMATLELQGNPDSLEQQVGVNGCYSNQYRVTYHLREIP